MLSSDSKPPVPPNRLRNKLVRSLGWTAVVLALLNLWIGIRLPVLLQESGLRYVDELERKIAELPNKQDVSILAIGNSHALAGLRPEVLTAGLGLRPGAVFSLSLPKQSAEEARLLLERYLPLFPRVETVVCMADPFLLTAEVELRMRYLTRESDRLRWRHALGQPDLERRVGLVLARYFPAADFCVPLRQAFSRGPMPSLARLLWDLPPANGTPVATERRHRYPWGLAPTWDLMSAAELSKHRRVSLRDWDLTLRAREFFLPVEARTPGALAELEAMRQQLEARGTRLVLVEAPLPDRMHGVIRRVVVREHAAYRAAMEKYVASRGVTYLQPATDWQEHWFYDGDHLNPDGARRLADWLKRHLYS